MKTESEIRELLKLFETDLTDELAAGFPNSLCAIGCTYAVSVMRYILGEPGLPKHDFDELIRRMRARQKTHLKN